MSIKLIFLCSGKLREDKYFKEWLKTWYLIQGIVILVLADDMSEIVYFVSEQCTFKSTLLFSINKLTRENIMPDKIFSVRLHRHKKPILNCQEE